ncbi:potassium transporter [Gammaproteobacteria bacterium]|nr:potassium transporter [Gammaproteobacteria bacterium]
MIAISRVMGILMIGFSFTYLAPVIVSLIYTEHEEFYFFITFAVTLLTGIGLWLPFINNNAELRTRDGFVIVTLFWTVLAIFSALPLFLSTNPNIGFTKAVFEATSGFTTTGATVLKGLDTMPKSILWYRMQLHFLGGLGIIVLAVAIMPLLGMGGMALFKAETPGPMKDEKITPRIAHTARNLWYVYLGLYFACAVSYYVGGMSAFDALTHSFSTVATAGFSNYDDSLKHFNSPFIEWTAIVFMFLGGLSFTLHFLAFRGKKLSLYLQNIELRVFVGIIVIVSLIITLTLMDNGVYNDIHTAFRTSLFQVIAMMTTTGFTTANFSQWPVFLPLLLIFMSFFGGCAGSTSGGIKIIRIILIVKQSGREIMRLIHPRAILHIKLGKRVIPESILGGVWAFLGIYAFSTGILTLVMIGFGLSPLDAFSAVAACLNVTGPGLGAVADNYASVSDGGLWVLIFAMLLGRLEIFTVFVLLTPAFWRD